ncbi:MAG TPA: hypothetical protein ENH33_05645 [Actinobacteria bacterium]|nr:hypothetical protein [Actinomycetota bacterium]
MRRGTVVVVGSVVVVVATVVVVALASGGREVSPVVSPPHADNNSTAKVRDLTARILTRSILVIG